MRRTVWRGVFVSSRRRLVLATVAVVAAAAATYSQAVGYGFIYDDYWTIVANPHLEKGALELSKAALSGRAIEWGMPDATRPLMAASMWLDRKSWGLSPAGYHAHSLALYALTSALAFLLAFALLRRLAAAFAAGLVFAMAPVHAEVVAAVNYREDLLAGAGLLGALVLFFWPARGEVSVVRRYAGVALWGGALLAKESALIGPLLVLVLARVRRPARSVWGGQPPLGLLGAVVAVAWLHWRFGAFVLGDQIPRADYASLSERLLRTARFELVAVAESVWPFGARPEYDPAGAAGPWWALALGAVIASSLWGLRSSGMRVFSAALLFALFAPLLTSPLAAPINEFADRYWFVGSFAAALLVGAGVAALSSFRARARPRWAAWASASAVLALLVLELSAARAATRVWSSEVALWTRAVEVAPESPRAWTSLSRVLRLTGETELSERAAQRALSKRSNYVSAHVARVLNWLSAGELSAAREALGRIEPETRLHREAFALAARCAASASAEQARQCVQRAVPAGMVLGDAERSRAFAIRALAAQ